MEIDANRRLFANVHRLDVKKTATTFEQCLLYVDNRLVMQGKGIITAITNDTVKVQIVGGKSRIKYNSKFENHYIDEIDFPPVSITHGYDKEAYAQWGLDEPTRTELARRAFLLIDLTKSNFVGQPALQRSTRYGTKPTTLARMEFAWATSATGVSTARHGTVATGRSCTTLPCNPT